jgi:hypothetical protein
MLKFVMVNQGGHNALLTKKKFSYNKNHFCKILNGSKHAVCFYITALYSVELNAWVYVW